MHRPVSIMPSEKIIEGEPRRSERTPAMNFEFMYARGKIELTAPNCSMLRPKLCLRGVGTGAPPGADSEPPAVRHHCPLTAHVAFPPRTASDKGRDRDAARARARRSRVRRLNRGLLLILAIPSYTLQIPIIRENSLKQHMLVCFEGCATTSQKRVQKTYVQVAGAFDKKGSAIANLLYNWQSCVLHLTC